MSLLATLLSAARRALLGISAEEIRYTIEDVRREIRGVRAELHEQIAALRRELAGSREGEAGRPGQDRAEEPEAPTAEA